MILYTEDKTKKLQKTMRNCRNACLILLAVATLCCIILCMLTRTGIDQIMMFSACGVFTVSGWIAIELWLLKGRPSARLAAHMEGILKAETEGDTAELLGTISKTKQELHIPNSIDVLWVGLKNGEETKRLRIPANWAAQLPQDGSRVCIWVTRGYIVEVKHASD